jgi:hypothetical protein
LDGANVWAAGADEYIMQNWEEHRENHDRFVKSCLDELATRLPIEATLQSRCETAVQPAAVQS